MNTKPSHSSPIEFLKRIGAGILALTGLLSGLYGLVQLTRGDSGVLTVLALVIFIGGLWLISIYAYFRKASPLSRVGFTASRPSGKFFYSSRVRHLSFAGIIAIPILVSCTLGIWMYIRNLPSDKTIILIADFPSLDGENYGVTEKIIEQLRASTTQFPDLKVETLKQPITAQEGSDVARAMGKERKATIVLWGWYKRTDANIVLSAHFEVLHKPALLTLRQEKEELNLAREGIETFEIQTRLSNELTYLTLFTVGLARVELGDCRPAISLFNKALMQNAVPEQMVDPTAVYLVRGNCYVMVGNYDRAISDFDNWLRVSPEHSCAACVYHNRASAYFLKGNCERAITDFSEAIKRAPDYGYSYEGRGNCYAFKGNYEASIADYNQAIKYQPSNGNAYVNRGASFSSIGDYDRAIADFNQAIILKGDLFTIYADRGIAYKAKGNLVNALSDFDAALKLDPSAAAVYNERGMVYVLQKKYGRAIADFSQALILQPNLADAYYQRGIAYDMTGDKKKAINDLSTFLNLTMMLRLAVMQWSVFEDSV
jgi:tetratricopeptide (TPR) repeat protein